MKRSGKFGVSDEKELNNVINTLASGKRLDRRCQDHSLTGDMSDYRECHIKSDLLLIYRVYDNELILVLANIGSHPDLF